MIVRLVDAVPATCGGKAAALAQLVRAGLPVPDGFVVTPGPLAHGELAAAHQGLGGGPVAVRSSALAEDGASASFAGQHDSVLGVVGEEPLLAAVERCRRSLRSTRAVAYREAVGGAAGDGGAAMAVLVQLLVDAEVAGVAFTVDPVTGADAVVVEASFGLGEGVVGGVVDPDRFRVEGGLVAHRTTGSKALRADRSPRGGTTRTPVPQRDRERPCLEDRDVLEIARLARSAAHVLGGPVDVEWALTGGRSWLLQARPVTALRPTGHDGATPATAGADRAGTTVLHGTPGSPGAARGRARVLHGLDGVTGMQAGEVLVCRQTDPSWTPLLLVASAVVTEIGGLLSHAAIVARERGIPAVLGVPGAVAALGDGPSVAVDGDRGTVTVEPP